MEAKIKGIIQVKRKYYWATRYGMIVDSRFLYYKKKDSASPRGWLDLEDCYIKTKLTDKKEQVIILNQIMNKNTDQNNKL